MPLYTIYRVTPHTDTVISSVTGDGPADALFRYATGLEGSIGSALIREGETYFVVCQGGYLRAHALLRWEKVPPREPEYRAVEVAL